MAAITSIKDLHTAIATWFEQNITVSRLQSGDKTRQWSTGALKYNDQLTQAAMRAFIDRTQLNTDYVTQYQAKTPAEKKALVFNKIEISALYTFLKCFVERHKVRMMYYRDDLSQKGARVMYNVKLSNEFFDQVKQQLES